MEEGDDVRDELVEEDDLHGSGSQLARHVDSMHVRRQNTVCAVLVHDNIHVEDVAILERHDLGKKKILVLTLTCTIFKTYGWEEGVRSWVSNGDALERSVYVRDALPLHELHVEACNMTSRVVASLLMDHSDFVTQSCTFDVDIGENGFLVANADLEFRHFGVNRQLDHFLFVQRPSVCPNIQNSVNIQVMKVKRKNNG